MSEETQEPTRRRPSRQVDRVKSLLEEAGASQEQNPLGPTPEPEPEPIAPVEPDFETVPSAAAPQTSLYPPSIVSSEPPPADPWDVLRHALTPEAFDALLRVMPNAPIRGGGDAPWYRCMDPQEGRPTGHPPFQSRANTQAGQHVYCPFVLPTGQPCNRVTVEPIEDLSLISA